MTARDTFIASVSSAQATAVASDNANALTCNNSILNGTSVAAAQATLVQNNLRTEMLRQVQIQQAKDILKGTGDTAPA
jgi:hypothetical protein